MMKLRLLLMAVVMLASFAFATSQSSAFNILEKACDGKGKEGSVCQQVKNQNDDASNTNPVIIKIRQAANLIALLAGIIAVITLIYSGFQFITAGGVIGGQRAGDNPGGAKKARSTLISTLVGLVIIALAWSIVNIVLNAVG